MTIPATAKQFTDFLDPEEEIDFKIDLSTLMEPGEAIASGAWTLEVLTEGTALGLEIMTGSGRDPALADDALSIRFWLAVDALLQGSAEFEDGVDLPMRITAPTTVSPARTRQRTFTVKVVHQ